MSEESDFHLSDEELDDSKHQQIVENVLNLNKVQHVKKASRSEPTIQVSEFNLVKSITGRKGSIQVDDLANVLKTKRKHANLGRRVEATKKKARTLPKPLEKPQADLIKRTVGYEKNRYLFDRWEAFVTSNRAQAHQNFPLGDSKLKINEPLVVPTKAPYKSKLHEALDKVDAQVFHIENVEPEDREVTLTLAEMKETRAEQAKLRAHLRFKEAKARRQNKIKSKKYHRLLRKEKIKQQIQEFEMLQKTDPEKALKKLDEIEKVRAMERFSLRHKSTGQWAKSKQIRAKYDKESRQVLAEQLRISKELTQKRKQDSDSDDEVEPSEMEVVDNSWTLGTKPDKEVTDFVTSYKKFWSEEAKNDVETTRNDAEEIDVQDSDVEESGKYVRKPLTDSEDEEISENIEPAKKKLKNTKQKEQKKEAKRNQPKSTRKSKEKTSKSSDLTMAAEMPRPIINEQMQEEYRNHNTPQSSLSIDALNSILNTKTSQKPTITSSASSSKTITVTNLDGESGYQIFNSDDEYDDENAKIVMEAFEDTELTADFHKEKKSEQDKDKPQTIDLNLPGWGSWIGAGINPKKQRKRRRFIVKMPEVLPRRDDNKGSLIINEKAISMVKPHLVSEVPFPLKTVKDYEASIRAPISNTFVPEAAFQRLIRPRVRTKIGEIIEPATTSLLMGKPKS